jgi:Tfp pilus assembly protein PilF
MRSPVRLGCKWHHSAIIVCHVQAKIRLVEAYLAAGNVTTAAKYLRLAVEQDKGFKSTQVYRELADRLERCCVMSDA